MLSSTCTEKLEAIYGIFDADFVVMCQDGVSQADTQFYTEVENVQADYRIK